MKIAVPTNGDKGLEEPVGEHFGRVPGYTIVDDETGDVEVIENTSHHLGGRGYPPEILAEAGVEVLLCRGLGRRAIQMFIDKGIKVYCEASGTVKDALQQWKNDSLTLATEGMACTRHAFRSHVHGKGRGKRNDG
jgi:predicted Fe-Mo cluster-binding NifX family protein